MKIPLNWIKQYVDLEEYSVQEIADTLTNLGLEVESVEAISLLDDKVVVGKILAAEPHPNAEKLQVCNVDVGAKQPLTIVCGAPNAREGLLVATAQVGAVLPGAFKIKASKIRGEKSSGMLCSAKELGIGTEDDGIIELESNSDLGTPLNQLYKLNDTIFEIGLTPNRSDCLGYIGVARDLAAKLKKPLRIPLIPEDFGDSTLDTQSMVKVDIVDNEACGRFTALYVENVKTIASPLWLQRFIENAGMRSINLVVDVTNFVMLETAQPIHAYDLRDIEGGVIRVRLAQDGETLTTLDGQERKLQSQDIVIADEKKAVGLAGVMGGENSEVKSDTSAIVIEVAHFNPIAVRKTAKLHNIHSEASHRFERGIDISNTAYVAQRVAQLLVQCLKEQDPATAVRTAGTIIDIYPQALIPAKIALRTDRLRKLTGIRSITQSECIDYLQGLGFKFLDKTEERALFEVPSWRLDIERETDLIEEVARLHGYNKIPNTLPMMEIRTLPERPLISFLDECKYTIATQGYSEVISFPFISNFDLERFNIKNTHPFSAAVELLNPLVEEQRQLRTSVVFGLLKALVTNRKHGVKGVRLFEAARNFYRFDHNHSFEFGIWKHLQENGSHITGQARQDYRPIERNIIAAILDHPFTEKTWQSPEIEASFFHGKEALTNLVHAMGVRDIDFTSINAEEIPWLHPGAAATVHSGSLLLGYVGELHPRTVKAYELNLDHSPVVFEVDIEQVYLASQQGKHYRGSITKYPPLTRDLAFVVEKSIIHSDFCDAFESFNRRKNLSSYRLFDVYEGKNLASGKKSMAFSLEFQSDKKTLTDKEVEKEVQALVDWFKQRLSAELR